MVNPQKIIDDNIEMHNQPGYAGYYDSNMGIIQNRWERKIFLTHLETIATSLREKFPDEQLLAIDMGAGTGNLTLHLLELGMRVTAVDLSQSMLDVLVEKAEKLRLNTDKLEIICDTADSAIKKFADEKKKFHLVSACSFYHHLPDYFRTIDNTSKLITRGGFFYCAHEPMKKNTISLMSKLMQWADFKLWRLKIHAAGIAGKNSNDDDFYNPDSQADYWDMTTGCNQEKIKTLLNGEGFSTKLICYDSKRSLSMHRISKICRTKTLFAMIAEKTSKR